MRKQPHTSIHDPDRLSDILLECMPGKLSRLTTAYWSDLIYGLNLADYPEATQLRIIKAREKIRVQKDHEIRIRSLKQDFFNFATEHHAPAVIARHGPRKARTLLKRDMVSAFRADGWDLPPYLVSEFVNDYVRDTINGGLVLDTWKKINAQLNDFDITEEAEAIP